MNQDDQLNYKNLRRIQQQETNSPMLTSIDACFYEKFKEYLTQLEKIAEEEKNGQKIKLYSDEIKNIKKIGISIYEIREKKIVQAALSTVRGANVDMKNITEKEEQFYQNLVEQIKSSRIQILDEDTQKKPKTIENQKIPKQTTKNPHAIVRVIQDTPAFVGTDMKTYSLRIQDILTLPSDMIDLLLKKQIVEVVNHKNT
jgi:DNA replication initiation complex subunit (GINS family)